MTGREPLRRRLRVALVFALVVATSLASGGTHAGGPADPGRLTTFYVGGHTVHLVELSPALYREWHERDGVAEREPPFGKLARGYVQQVVGNRSWIVVEDGAWGEDALVAHEVGHVLGLDHTPLWQPTTMNPCGCMRWWEQDELLRMVNAARAKGHPGEGGDWIGAG